ncbi:MAG: lipid II flippase Amj family protein [Thermovenabulum sp.]|uniref:lipid II flippase Amj family protein n=1 Tax=Thermovenabulum sp. TaxID=3100335 RepID=UPI003C7A5E7C
MERVFYVALFTATVHMIDTLSYSVRLAGVRTKRLALALSLFNIIVLISRTANMIQAPLLGSIVDKAIAKGEIRELLHSFRIIIFSATFGSIIGAALIPSFIEVFSKGIYALEKTGSIPKLIVKVIFNKPIKHMKNSLKAPDLKKIKKMSRTGISPFFLIFNLFITSISTIGVLAAIYAGALLPEYRITASQLSGVINGTATILLAVIVDPQAALITDQALQGIKSRQEVTSMVFFLVSGKIIGTLLSQIIFLPAAEVVLWITKKLI